MHVVLTCRCTVGYSLPFCTHRLEQLEVLLEPCINEVFYSEQNLIINTLISVVFILLKREYFLYPAYRWGNNVSFTQF
uniref:EGF-like domain-containing protein n=1 Tax=Strigamia maritima TaxID=126957 RepID=T1J537_STRMM